MLESYSRLLRVCPKAARVKGRAGSQDYAWCHSTRYSGLAIPVSHSTHLVDDPDLTEEGGDTVGGTALDVLYVVGLWQVEEGGRWGAKWVGERTRVGGKQFPCACAVRREKLSRGGHKDRAEDGVWRTQREHLPGCGSPPPRGSPTVRER